VRNAFVSLTMPLAHLLAVGVIPTWIGILGEHGFFSLGIVLVGVLLIGIVPLLKYLRFYEDVD
jgi:hypothetical protein